MHARYLILLLIIVVTSSCKKDKLTGTYDRIEGEYKYVFSEYVSSQWLIFWTKSSLVHFDANQLDYSAGIEFDNKGRVYFIIDDAVFLKRRYRIKEQSEYEGRLNMELWVDVNDKDLNINDELHITHFGEDTLVVFEYPGPGYDPNVPSYNYFVRIK